MKTVILFVFFLFGTLANATSLPSVIDTAKEKQGEISVNYAWFGKHPKEDDNDHYGHCMGFIWNQKTNNFVKFGSCFDEDPDGASSSYKARSIKGATIFYKNGKFCVKTTGKSLIFDTQYIINQYGYPEPTKSGEYYKKTIMVKKPTETCL